mmetsp:Transcript_38174/g.87333  ORF Transcript_38174/g.87333 Transcript_38174/m.87333 type:complete len:757 (-) Transcript_38174:206-2476(-)
MDTSLQRLDALIEAARGGAAPLALSQPTPASSPPVHQSPSTDASSADGVDAALERKYALIRSVGEECVSEGELRLLLSKKPNFILYDGFEPSGRMHIAQGIFKAMNVNKCTSAGGTFIFWVADWFALMNDKMGGDLERIKTVGEYLIRVWTAAGMDMSRVKFLWSSEEITKHAPAYWTQALDIARSFSVNRIKKCCQIMGRKEDTLTAAQILYPIMQCTDIFFLKADVCQLGVDQRKVNMLAREYCDAAGIKLKPVILSHHMLYGLAKGQEKMSKSTKDKDSAIFMEDSPEDVERKIMKAYCPREEGEVVAKPSEDSMQLIEDKLKNPCLDYVQHIVFAAPNAKFVAGSTTFASFEAVRDAFLTEKLSEEDLKKGLITALNRLLQPVREHFTTDPEAVRILTLISEWLAEPKDMRPCALRRLCVFDDSTLSWVVHAPLPTPQPTAAALLDTLRCLRAAPDSHRKVLWLPDWSAFCLNCLGGGKTPADDLRAIGAFNELFVAGLRALAPALMAEVKLVVQSQVLLTNPSDYWISVINAGRAFQLSRVLHAVGEPSPDAGHVLAALMHVADVLAVVNQAGTVLCCTPSHQLLAELAIEYVQAAVAGQAELCAPQLHVVPSVPLRLKADDGKWDPEAELLLLDSQADLQRKLKRAFCEPGNVEFCPPIVLAEEIILQYAPIARMVVTRKPENGGDLQFSSGEEIRNSFVKGDLHPGDLKPSVRDGVDAILDRVRKVVSSDKTLKDAEKELTKVLKRKKK